MNENSGRSVVLLKDNATCFRFPHNTLGRKRHETSRPHSGLGRHARIRRGLDATGCIPASDIFDFDRSTGTEPAAERVLPAKETPTTLFARRFAADS